MTLSPGLPNRRSLMADLEQGLVDAHSASSRRCCSLFDLDGFKAYNDSFGHPAGDTLLRRLGGTSSARSGGREATEWVATSSACWEPRRRRCALGGARHGGAHRARRGISIAARPARSSCPRRGAAAGAAHCRPADVRAKRSASGLGAAARRGGAAPARVRARSGACEHLDDVGALAGADRERARPAAMEHRPPSSRPRRCTTSARWRSPARSSTSPARSTRSK